MRGKEKELENIINFAIKIKIDYDEIPIIF